MQSYLYVRRKANKITLGVNAENASLEVIKNNKKVKVYEEDKN